LDGADQVILLDVGELGRVERFGRVKGRESESLRCVLRSLGELGDLESLVVDLVVGDPKTCEVISVGGSKEDGRVARCSCNPTGGFVKIWTTLLSFCILNVAGLLFRDARVSGVEGCERLH
jgi:hypothetical protein